MSDDLMQAALAYHAEPTPGKISVELTKPAETQLDLSLAYSPGVAEPCRAIAADKANAYRYTGKGNLVAVISNGTAVLGLGNIGPLAAKPVMEGKGCLFKKFAGIDVFDIELAEDDPDALIEMFESATAKQGAQLRKSVSEATLAALQGLVNRDAPRHYLFYCSGFGVDTDRFWFDWLRGDLELGRTGACLDMDDADTTTAAPTWNSVFMSCATSFAADGNQQALSILHRLDIVQSQHTAPINLDAVGCSSTRGSTTDMEGTHSQLRTWLTNRLSGNNTDRFATVD